MANSLTTKFCNDLTSYAHNSGLKALISVAEYNGTGFPGATSGANRATFISNLVSFMSARGYDGIDIDWEPLKAAEIPQYTNFIKELRIALNALNPPRLLTVAAASQPECFASIQNQIDQINLMTYDLGGAWPGWVTWFNAPIYDGGYRFPSTGGLIPSADGLIHKFTDAGVSPSRLGIGVAFYGLIWSGGTGTTTGGAAWPRQTWTTAPTTSAMSYWSIMDTYYQPALYHWDDAAQAAYLSIDNSGSANDKLVSYDDERTCKSKVSYARNNALGGVMIWELGQGYRSSEPVGRRDPLLQAIKQGMVATPDIVSVSYAGSDLLLKFKTLPLGLYRVQWTTNVASGAWFTLTNNIAGQGSDVVVADYAARTNAQPRFYRVQTPP